MIGKISSGSRFQTFLENLISCGKTFASSLDGVRIINGYGKYIHWKERELCLSWRALPKWRGESQAEAWDEIRWHLGTYFALWSPRVERSCLAPDFPALDGSRVREPLHLLLPVLAACPSGIPAPGTSHGSTALGYKSSAWSGDRCGQALSLFAPLSLSGHLPVASPPTLFHMDSQATPSVFSQPTPSLLLNIGCQEQESP